MIKKHNQWKVHERFGLEYIHYKKNTLFRIDIIYGSYQMALACLQLLQTASEIGIT
jgi:hypothetical protein